jgi:pimeloyl-ACP methyl ester carboxylesterase
MHRVVSQDGTPIAVFRSGSGPALVLVHGTSADHTRWARIAPAFEKRHTVYAVDRRGRGGSGDSPDYAIEREAEDIAAVVDSVGAPVVLLGHSYGAICSLEAARLTNGVARLVLYEPPVPTGITIVPTGLRLRIEACVAANRREEALELFFREVVCMPDEQLEMLRSDPAWRARIAAAHTVPREMRVEETYRFDAARFAALRTPTLLLLGGASPRFFAEATRQLDAALPDSRVAVLPGEQHVAMDSAPELFVRTVSEFITPIRA